MIETKGVIHGKTIELDEDLGFKDGDSVKVTVRPALPPKEGILQSAGGWADGGEEMDEWFEKLQRARRQGRPEPE